MTFHYHFGGVAIDSQLEFKRLRPAAAGCGGRGTLRIEAGQGPAPEEDRRVYGWPGRFGMKLGVAGADWRLVVPEGVLTVAPDGSLIRVFRQGEDETFLKDIVVRRVLPRMLKLLGAETYHAGSLEKDGRAILLLGSTGAGKSTMTVGLGLAAGWRVLGDDMALTWHGERETVVEPAGADVAIWPQSSAGLALPGDRLKALRGYDGKNSFHPAALQDGISPAAPIRAIFFIERADLPAPQVTPISRGQAMKLALKQLAMFNPAGEGKDERVASALRLGTMLARVPAFSLHYPPGYDGYPAVSAVIEAALGED